MTDRASAPTTSRTWRGFAAVVGALALWGTVAPYAGKPLGFEVATRPIVEVVDHVIPGVVLLLLAAAAGITGRGPLVGALLAVLAALWMAATHVPLVLQAGAGDVGWGAALWHSLPGLLLFVVTVGAAVVAYSEPLEPGSEAPATETPPREHPTRPTHP